MSLGRKFPVVWWILWSVVVVLIACRIASRRINLRSSRKFQLDDWIMLLVILTFTGLIVSTNVVAKYGSNYLPTGAAEKLTPLERRNVVYGSKMTIVLEECTLCTLWLVKACIILLYHRFTFALRRNLLVKLLEIYCLFGSVVTQVSLLGFWCRPLSGYWTISPRNAQCANYRHHLIVVSTFNISSDLIMLFIPMPLLINSRLPIRRKIVLCLVFSLGIFVILAAVLNRYFAFSLPYNPRFVSQPLGQVCYMLFPAAKNPTQQLNWYVGEVSTAVYVGNIPLCWPLIQYIFSLDRFTPYSQSPPAAPLTPPILNLQGLNNHRKPKPNLKTKTTNLNIAPKSTNQAMPPKLPHTQTHHIKSTPPTNTANPNPKSKPKPPLTMRLSFLSPITPIPPTITTTTTPTPQPTTIHPPSPVALPYRTRTSTTATQHTPSRDPENLNLSSSAIRSSPLCSYEEMTEFPWVEIETVPVQAKNRQEGEEDDDFGRVIYDCYSI